MIVKKQLRDSYKVPALARGRTDAFHNSFGRQSWNGGNYKTIKGSSVLSCRANSTKYYFIFGILTRDYIIYIVGRFGEAQHFKAEGK